MPRLIYCGRDDCKDGENGTIVVGNIAPRTSVTACPWCDVARAAVRRDRDAIAADIRRRKVANEVDDLGFDTEALFDGFVLSEPEAIDAVRHVVEKILRIVEDERS